MKQTLGHIALVVRDYDEALEFFTQTLNFKLIEDTRLSETKRWVLVAPRRIKRHKLTAGAGGNAGTGDPNWQPDRRPRLSFSLHRRLLARLQRNDGPQSEVHAATKRRTLRNCRCLRRSIRQSMGFVAAENVAGGLAQLFISPAAAVLVH
jgi:catechol 2,3-dioxygenase-like lactoylglutathione lyase family enzyme